MSHAGLNALSALGVVCKFNARWQKRGLSAQAAEFYRSDKGLISKPWRHVVHTFIEAPKGKSSEAAHITSESTPLSVLLLFFAEIITLLVVETNWYYQQYLDNSDEGPSPQHEVTEAEMFAFLAMTLQMGHTVQDRLEDYWTKMEQLCIPFYGQTMACARYFHILRFLHFTDNHRNGVDRTDDRYETCLKL